MTLNTAVVAPIPSTRETNAVSVSPGLLTSCLMEYLRSSSTSPYFASSAFDQPTHHFNALQSLRIRAPASRHRANPVALVESFDSPASDARDLSERPQTVAGPDRPKWKFP